eukprot:3251860-Ditylum_brightwellii.AAC.1
MPSKGGVVLKKNWISHLLYIDDLKLYARKKKKLERMLKIVEDFSTKIKMMFGLDECTILIIKKGNYHPTNILPPIPKLDDIEDKWCRCLGIMKGIDFHIKDTKEQTKKEYFSQLRNVFKSSMTGENIMVSICAYTILVPCYNDGVSKWTKGEFKNMNAKTCKLLTMHGFHCLKANTHMLYFHCSDGGRFLTDLEDIHNNE